MDGLCRTLRSVLLLAPLVLVGPLLLLAEAVLTLGRYGPPGWLAAAALVLAVLWASGWVWQRTRRWWATTRAPTRTGPAPRGPGPHRR